MGDGAVDGDPRRDGGGHDLSAPARAERFTQIAERIPDRPFGHFCFEKFFRTVCKLCRRLRNDERARQARIHGRNDGGLGADLVRRHHAGGVPAGAQPFQRFGKGVRFHPRFDVFPGEPGREPLSGAEFGIVQQSARADHILGVRRADRVYLHDDAVHPRTSQRS